LHGHESGRIVRLPHGEYIEVHEQADQYEIWKLTDFKEYSPTLARPNAKGVITVRARIRSAMSKWFFEDRVSPVGSTELEAAKNCTNQNMI
jgi:ubiquinol-cytochrome c reductase cytochrome b subunit